MGKESRDNISVQFIVGVVSSIAAVALVAVAGAVFGVMSKPMTLPLWGYLTVFTTIIVAFAIILFLITRTLREQLKENEKDFDAWQEAERKWEVATEDYQKQIKSVDLERQKLWIELHDYKNVEFVPEVGFCYRKTDLERKQPYCIRCWEDKNHKFTTITNIWSDGYHCPVCEASYTIPEDDGWE